MKKMIFQRLLYLIPLFFFVTMLVFLLMYLSPGDFLTAAKAQRDVSEEHIKALEQSFGLDQAWYVQYFLWIKNIAKLDFGYSWTYKVGVIDLLIQRAPATLALSVCSILISWSLAIPLGILAAIYKGSLFDRISAVLAYAALSVPEFFLALLAIIFAAKTGILPMGGLAAINHEFLSPLGQFTDYLHHLILPSLVLGIGGVAGIMRIMRSNFLDAIRSEYVTTARAKGIPEGVIMFRHVLRNAINPLISIFGFTFSGLLSGALIVENVMNFPGLGRLVFEALLKEDQFVVMGAVVMGCAMLVFGNLIADILLAASDPRIRYGKT